MARFQPQAWINDNAVDVDGAHEIDITDRVVAMGKEKAMEIGDCSYESDALVEGLHDHNGPFSVYVEGAIRDYYGE